MVQNELKGTKRPKNTKENQKQQKGDHLLSIQSVSTVPFSGSLCPSDPQVQRTLPQKYVHSGLGYHFNLMMEDKLGN